jgi:hypothetical protein
MIRDRLFLLKPHFYDGDQGPFFCPECAQIMGLLQFYPELRQRLDVTFLEFVRPRRELVEWLGPEHQSCPTLLLASAPTISTGAIDVQTANGRWFLEGADAISRYLAHAYGIGMPH